MTQANVSFAPFMTSATVPFISVCIPAYHRIHYLERLLQSLVGQTFRNFEVIVSDDSRDDSVAQLCRQFEDKFSLQYHKHQPVAGKPTANWNNAIDKANGEWIKLMHDDDWLAAAGALQKFADATKSGKKFIFSAYANFFEENKATETVRLSSFWKKKIRKQPALLMAKNVVGPPSVSLVHRSIKEKYDERLKWRVDTDFYERVLRDEKDYRYINDPLILVSISESQVTQSCLYKPEIELPEGLILIEKYGVTSLKNILVYDAWWRLFRNMNIVRTEQLHHYTQKEWPPVFAAMIHDLSRVPAKLLRTGILSKLMMGLSYIRNRTKI